MAKLNERIASLETTCRHMAEMVAEIRDTLLGDNGHSTRLTRVEEQVQPVTTRSQKNEDAINRLTLKVASASGLTTIVVMLIGKVLETFS